MPASRALHGVKAPMGAWPRGVWGPTRCPGSQRPPRVLSPHKYTLLFFTSWHVNCWSLPRCVPAFYFSKPTPPRPPPPPHAGCSLSLEGSFLSFLSFSMCSDQNLGKPSCPNNPLAFRCPFCTQGQPMIVKSLMGILPDMVLSEGHAQGRPGANPNTVLDN